MKMGKISEEDYMKQFDQSGKSYPSVMIFEKKVISDWIDANKKER